MVCSACQDKPRGKACSNCGKLPPVMEVKSEECPVLFHTMELEGTKESNPPYIGRYKNVLTVYSEDGAKVLYSSDGIPSILATANASDFNVLANRPKYNGIEMTGDTDIPAVPTVGDGTLTIQRNSNSVGTFSANSDTDTTVNISVPTAVSELSDASDYPKFTDLATVATTGAYSDLSGTPNLAAVATSGAYSDLSGTPNLATVATTGDYDDLTNKPNLAAVATSGSYTDLSNKPVVDTAYSASSDNAIANSTVTNSLDRNVVTALVVDPTVSTTTVQLDATNTNLKTPSSTTTTNISLPVASSTQAGIMNSSTYDAVTANTNNINALINGAVAITGLSANPSQSDLTTAWQTATGLTTLMNRAGIYDVTNQKVWTYYTNDTTWHAASNTSQVTVNQFTNSSLGTIKGSTVAGQVFAENDGTGSVNGWDTLNATVGDHTSKLATIAQGAEVNVQANWTEADSSSDAYILNKPNLATVATTGSYNDLSNKPAVDSALSTSSTNAVENQAIANEFEEVAYVGTTLSTPTDVAYVATANIQDNAVTAAKTNFGTFGSVSKKRSNTSVSLTANVWTTVATITIPANSTAIITSSVQIPNTTANGYFYIRIVSSDGATINGTSSCPSSTTSSTRLSTQCIITTDDSPITRLVQADSSVATGTGYLEVASLVLPKLPDGNLIS